MFSINIRTLVGLARRQNFNASVGNATYDGRKLVDCVKTIYSLLSVGVSDWETNNVVLQCEKQIGVSGHSP